MLKQLQTRELLRASMAVMQIDMIVKLKKMEKENESTLA